jgi:hypothetical protein
LCGLIGHRVSDGHQLISDMGELIFGDWGSIDLDALTIADQMGRRIQPDAIPGALQDARDHHGD